MKERLSANESVSLAMKQVEPGVVAAFPITPSTEIPQYFSSFVNDGVVDTSFITVESEHSALSASIGASCSGVRSVTATSANGLAFMWEMLYIASGMRLPIVMTVANRALSAPINIHNDHSDSMGARDSGWIQIYGENSQESYDNFIQAIRISEDERVRLPVMNCYDGFITSHSVENIDLLDKEEVKNFVGEYNPKFSLLKKEKPVSFGPLDLPIYYPEHKKQQANSMKNSKNIIMEVAKEFEKLTGRSYGLIEEFKMNDAEIAIVILSSGAGTAKYVARTLRETGIKAGVLKIRVYRPFPYEEIKKSLTNVLAVAILDKCDSLNGFGGPVFTDVATSVYGSDIKLINYIYGLGGRDLAPKDIKTVYDRLINIVETNRTGEVFNYLNIE